MVYALRIETVSEGGRQVAQASLCHYRPKATKTGLCPIHRGCIAMSGARSRVPLCAFAKGGKPQKPPNFVPRQVAQASLCHYRPKATKTGLCPIHRGCIAMSGARSRQPCRPLRFDLHNTLDSCRVMAGCPFALLRRVGNRKSHPTSCLARTRRPRSSRLQSTVRPKSIQAGNCTSNVKNRAVYVSCRSLNVARAHQ
jgi:hypothetical protein